MAASGAAAPAWSYEAAMAALDARVNFEAMAAGRVAPPSLDRIGRLMALMAEPQHQYAVVHLTGTNGKTSTARMLTSLLVAQGLSVGTYTSPHLEVVNERIQWQGSPISDASLSEAIGSVVDLETTMGGERLSWFELVTAAAFRWFADVAVDVAVVEVGLGGRWDATNVADGAVAVVTNVGIDHVEYLGPTRHDIAAEKAGIVKPGATLVLGETDPALTSVFEAAGAGAVWLRDDDFSCAANRPAVGGRLLDLRTPGAIYDDVFVGLHGAYQGDNAACALAAAEAFFGVPLTSEVVADAFAGVRSPGRMEVVRRRPLCILDGAHNVDGAGALAASLAEEFGTERRRIVVIGVSRGHDPTQMLSALDPATISHVVACASQWARAVPAPEVAEAARALGLGVEIVPGVPEAVERAMAGAGADDLVLITGSLYVVGPARAALVPE